MYQLGEVIGRGATGVVHRSHDPVSGRHLAVKVLHPHLMGDAKATSRFVQERDVLSRVSHPNVVEVVELVAEDHQLSIVMELVDGGDLKQLHQRARPLPSEAVTMAARIADALAALHAAGVVHRDLKPANVLIEQTADGPVPKITDLGLSRLVEEGMSQSSAAVGTPLYMAPEAVERASTAGPPADVYSLGIMLYELLVGTPPFVGGGTMAILRAHSQEVPPTIEGVPAELQATVRQTLAKDPYQRPTAAELRDRLQAVINTVDDTVSPRAVSAPDGSRALLVDDPDATVAVGAAPAPAALSKLVALPERRIGPWPAERVMIAAATALAALVLAGVLVGVKVVGGDEVDPDAYSYAFDPQLVGEVGIATRHWSLSSDGAQLTGELTVFNRGGSPLSFDFVEVLPESAVADIADVRFEPSPGELLGEDRAAVLRIDGVGSGATADFTYTIDLGRGDASLDRLTALALDQIAAEKAFYSRLENADREEPESLDITELSITPGDLNLRVGDEQDLVLAGRLADGSAAPAEALASAAWSTSDPAVAALVGNRVVSRAAGTATITAQVGEAVASVPLLVADPIELVAGPVVNGNGGDDGGDPGGRATGKGGTSADAGARTDAGGAGSPGAVTPVVPVSPVTPPDPAGPNPPGAPGTVSVGEGASLTSVNLSWAPPGDDGGAAVDQYEVRLVGGTAQAVGGTSYTWGGLAYASSYRFEARAHNSAGWGPWGGASGTFLTAQPPGKPVVAGPTVSQITETSAYVSFTSSTCTTADYSLVGTDIRHTSPGWPRAWQKDVDCWMNHGWKFTGLRPGATYTVAIDLHDTGGGSYKTNSVKFTTAGVETVIDALTNVSITSVTETSITVTGTSSVCAVMTLSILSTNISASNGPNCGTTFTHTFDRLTEGTSYFVVLSGKATNGGTLPGAGAAAATKRATPPATDPSGGATTPSSTTP